MPHYFNKIIQVLIFSFLSIGSLSAQKVFMTGDSHVYSKIYPNKVQEILSAQFPDMEFGYWAKNGICFYSFKSNPEYYDSIFKFNPEILLVHLGTNGAYAINFNRKTFRTEMERFYSSIKEKCPDVKVVFVTPFTNKRRYKKKGRWYMNTKNKDASDVIIEFAGEHPGTYVIDNNSEAGMMFLKTPGLIRTDNVHLTEKGYKKLGEMVGEELLDNNELWPQTASNNPQ